MLKYIDYFLDRITMYRLMLYYLIGLIVSAVGLSLFNVLNFEALGIVFSAVWLVIICWITNKVFSYVFKAPANIESVYITALILSLIITPFKVNHDLLFLTIAGILAISSKYILAIGHKHIFNPTAIAVVLTAAVAGESASWWVGSSAMVPFVVIGGLLIVRKIKHFKMVLAFFAVSLAMVATISLLGQHEIWLNLKATVLHSSLFFLGFVMLTEPLTSPSTDGKRLWYASLVGVLFPPQVHLLSLYSTPELALSVGNLFAYIVNPKYKILPKLIKKQKLSPVVAEFIFQPEQTLKYKAGQYMEWTLPHKHSDSRGNRRYFTLASSPTEKNIKLGVKFYPNGSSFKKALLSLDSSTAITAGQLGGNFVLPNDTNQKLVFIAGGVGVTPYRSMIKYMLDIGERRDVTLIYSENTADSFVYRDLFNEAERKVGLKTIYTLTDESKIPSNWNGQVGIVSGKLITSLVPNYKDCLFYISGPNSMVTAIKTMLKDLGVASDKIKTDFFPGYA